MGATVQRHFSSAILLWVRSDQPRQVGMDYWKGPHSKIIAASKGLEEYRQIHLADSNPGLWPEVSGVETGIPVERKIDGIADVTFQSLLSPLAGRPQTQLAFKDEINVFRRTLMYLTRPGASRRYQVAAEGENVGARAVVYLRRRDGVPAHSFRRLIDRQLVPALANMADMKELRTQSFLPWTQKLWDTPKVAHDNPISEQFHASVTLGFADAAARESFFERAGRLSELLAASTSAIHAYEVSSTLTYVRAGTVLPSPER